jgi:hypothetical protein
MKFVKRNHCTDTGSTCMYFTGEAYMLIPEDLIPCNWCTRANDIPSRDYHNFNWKS